MAIYTNGKSGLPQPGLDAARDGRTVCGFVNAKTGIDTEAVLTDAAFIHALASDERLVVTCFHMHINTASDWVTAEFGVTENADGSGAFTALTLKFRVESGAAAVGAEPALVHFDPPIALTTATGQRAFTARVQGNDAAASLTLGYNGWTEEA
jgi:hypothetical protein